MNLFINFIVGSAIAGADIALLAWVVGRLGKNLSQGRLMPVVFFLLLKFPLLGAAIYGMSQASWFHPSTAAAGLIAPFGLLMLAYTLRQFRQPAPVEHGR